jgi:transposase
VCLAGQACMSSVSPRRRRYPSDCTEAEWALLLPLLPRRADWRGGREGVGGRPEKHCRRTVIDAIRYLVKEGITWRALPADFPPWSTVYKYFQRWADLLAVDDLHDALRDRVRMTDGRPPWPTAAIIDSQSVKAAETVGRASRGYDAGKKINGRKRHIAVDVLGMLLAVIVTDASVQDRDAARPLLRLLRNLFEHVSLVWADGGYGGALLPWARQTLALTVRIVKRTDTNPGFQVVAHRWKVERTLAWITRHRRTVRDYERLPETHEAMVKWAMITTMTRKLTRHDPTNIHQWRPRDSEPRLV